nr:MAG TPA: hypothetical protein [Caudoviricetes sp.]
MLAHTLPAFFQALLECHRTLDTVRVVALAL